jgi:hypothetical protein
VTGGAYVSGNLGVGITNPTEKLDIIGNYVKVKNNSDASGGLVLDTGSTASQITQILLRDRTTDKWTIRKKSDNNFDIFDNNAASAALTILTGGTTLIGSATSTGTASQRLQVTGGAYVSGSVGVGTTSPGERLQVDGNLRLGISTTSNYIAFYGTTGDLPGSYNHTYIGERIWSTGTERSELFLFKGNDADASGGQDRIRLAAGQIRIDTFPSGTFVGGASFESVATSANLINRVVVHSTGEVGIGTDVLTGTSSQRLQVTGGAYVSGNLGVGTTNPGATLNVVPTATSIAGLFSGTTSSDMVRITQLGSGNALVVEDSANPDSSPFVVTGIGSVGIGTASPAFTADIAGDARVTSTNKMRFGGTAGTTNFYIQYNSTANSLDFVAG